MKATTLQPSPARRGAAIITSFAAAILIAAAGSASAGTFIDLRTGPGPDDRIEGESSDPGHEGWIEVKSMGFEADKGKHTTTRRRGAPRLGDVVVVREMDKSSTKLQEAVLTGEVFPEMTVEIEYGTDRPTTVVMLHDVILTGYQMHASGDSDEHPTEEVAFYYNKIGHSY